MWLQASRYNWSAPHPPGKEPAILGWSRCRFERSGEEKDLLSLTGIERWLLRHLSHSLVCIPSELSRLRDVVLTLSDCRFSKQQGLCDEWVLARSAEMTAVCIQIVIFLYVTSRSSTGGASISKVSSAFSFSLQGPDWRCPITSTIQHNVLFLGSYDRASWAKYEERRPTRCNN